MKKERFNGPDRRLIIEPFDPRVPMVGGVDTCIRGLLKYHPRDVQLAIVGLDVIGDTRLGQWITVDLDGRSVRFLPVYRGNNSVIRPRIPHAISLVLGALRYLPFQRGVSTVQTHRMSVGFAMRKLFWRKKHVQFVHNDGQDSLTVGSESYYSRAIWLFRYFERNAVRKSEDVVVFNREAAQRLSTHGSNVRFSPTWYDDEQFFENPDRGETARTEIAWLARFEPPKDPLLAVQAMANLSSEFHLTMMGGGSLLQGAKELAQSLGVLDRITFAGPIAKDEVGEEIRKFDALLMTSFHEGFPRAVVEALASGVPVVTTDGGEPNGLVVTGQNGVRIVGRDPQDVALAIREAPLVDRSQCRPSVEQLSASRLVPIVLGAV